MLPVFRTQLPQQAAQPVRQRASGGAPAVAGLGRAIANPMAEGVPPNGGAGGPGDPQRWQQDPLGNRWQWQQQDANGQGGKWIVAGNTVSEGVANQAAGTRDQTNAWNRARELQNSDETTQRRYDYEDEMRRRSQMKMDISDVMSGGGGEPPPIARVPTTAGGPSASSLAFARAKDRAGLATRGLLKSVQHNAAVRGISGSGIEGAASLDALSGGADRVAQAALAEEMANLERSQAVEDRDYAGGIAQRGQDIGERQAAADRAEARRRQILATITSNYGGRY